MAVELTPTLALLRRQPMSARRLCSPKSLYSQDRPRVQRTRWHLCPWDCATDQGRPGGCPFFDSLPPPPLSIAMLPSHFLSSLNPKVPVSTVGAMPNANPAQLSPQCIRRPDRALTGPAISDPRLCHRTPRWIQVSDGSGGHQRSSATPLPILRRASACSFSSCTVVISA